MYDQQQVFSDSLYVMVYGGSMVFALIACIYLLFRRSNAIAPEVTPPLRLRRRVAAFFAIMVISHLWWYVLVKYNFFGDLLSIIVAAGLDCVVLIPFIMGMLLAMLQDHRRPLWLFILASLPIVVLFAMMIDSHDVGLLSWVRGYFMLMTVVMFIYMAFAVRQYSLEHYCEERQLYLRQDITLSQLSKAIGTNRYYLSQYFTRQDTTYNAYINSLRIQHFVRLYQEASAAKRSFTAQQLAQECGFGSYSTFAVAFKQRMGQTVSTWMRNTAK